MNIFKKYGVVYTNGTNKLSTRFGVKHCRSKTLTNPLGESVKWKTTQTDTLYKGKVAYEVHEYF